MVLALISIVMLASGASDLVLLFSALGGLSGIAALVSVWVNFRNNERTADKEDKSVAIVELEKAVPGLGTIIKEWQSVVHQLQEDLKESREAEAELQRRLDHAMAELADCKARVTGLEARGNVGL